MTVFFVIVDTSAVFFVSCLLIHVALSSLGDGVQLCSCCAPPVFGGYGWCFAVIRVLSYAATSHFRFVVGGRVDLLWVHFSENPFVRCCAHAFFDVVEVFATACGKHAPHRTQRVSRPLPNTPP